MNRAAGLLWIALGLLSAADAGAEVAARVWLGVDAACDGGALHDVDDCLALVHLRAVAAHRLAGITTSFGNADRPVADRVVAELLALWGGAAGPPPVAHGATRAGDCRENRAAEALARALRRERLEILALGPLTNVACALGRHPELAGRVVRLVAVMGARPGHVFHPAEERHASAWLGHGPVFRDLNFVKDEEAARVVVESGVPLVLVPYQSARLREIGPGELAALAERGEAAAVVAERAVPWLQFWQEKAGRSGFYPFDLVAASVVSGAEELRCEPRGIEIARDRAMGFFARPVRLLLLGSRSVARTHAVVCAPQGGLRAIDVERYFPHSAAAAGDEGARRSAQTAARAVARRTDGCKAAAGGRSPDGNAMTFPRPLW